MSSSLINASRRLAPSMAPQAGRAFSTKFSNGFHCSRKTDAKRYGIVDQQRAISEVAQEVCAWGIVGASCTLRLGAIYIGVASVVVPLKVASSMITSIGSQYVLKNHTGCCIEMKSNRRKIHPL